MYDARGRTETDVVVQFHLAFIGLCLGLSQQKSRAYGARAP